MFSCDSFLDVQPKGKVIPDTEEDFDLMLNDGIYFIKYMDYYSPYVTLDNKDISSEYYRFIASSTWNMSTSTATDSDVRWEQAYKNLYVYNYVVNNIGNPESDLGKLVKGKALALRALSYFTLVNMYGQPYNNEYKNHECIPLLLKGDFDSSLALNTVDEVYTQVIKDLEEAEKLIPADYQGAVAFLPNLTGIKGLLGKIYLYRGEFQKAIGYFDQVLAAKNFLYDFNTESLADENDPHGDISVPKEYFNFKENIWGMEDSRGNLSNYYMDEMDMATDQRFKLFITRKNRYSYRPDYTEYYWTGQHNLFGVTTAETYLSRAECYARLNDKDKALADLNTLRVNRHEASVATVDATDANDALAKIKKERILDMSTGANSWFDLKRYQAYGDQVPTFERKLIVQGEEKTYTLKPGVENYTFLYPVYLKQFD
jgi:tetratricopeptide (TPR) repeat protein